MVFPCNSASLDSSVACILRILQPEPDEQPVICYSRILEELKGALAC